MKEHLPVMPDEVLAAAEDVKIKVFVDATLGLGGHSSLIMENHRGAFLYGFDQDAEAREIAAERLAPYSPDFEIIADNFRNISKLARREDFRGADFILFDLGVSNLQLTEGRRGFSFQNDGPLDMRMDSEDEDEPTAAELLNTLSDKDLTVIFRDYGEERFAYRIASGIVKRREKGAEIKTTAELTATIRKILPAAVQRKMGGHPARRIFQALRIAVNDELRALDEALPGALEILNPGGKVVVISYHSLEDRIVKHRFTEWRTSGIGELSPKKATVPSDEEIERNYRARSAKMRVFRKYATDEAEVGE